MVNRCVFCWQEMIVDVACLTDLKVFPWHGSSVREGSRQGTQGEGW